MTYGEAYDDGLGYEVNVRAGDINGDGFADFAASAPYNDAGGTNAGRVYVYGELTLLSSDPQALAYNGNRHLFRKPNTEELHLIYTHNGKIFYSNSSDGGITWDYAPFEVGQGLYPAITLTSQSNGYLPAITWTDDMGGIWFRRQTGAGAWETAYHLYAPWDYWQPRLNAPPSMVITPSPQGDTIHILVTMHAVANGPQNWVAEFTFPIQNPPQGAFINIEGGIGFQAGAIRYNPSIVRCDINNSLHAVWQREDTICYATRQLNQTWNNWGWVFDVVGLQSARPFVETYGDMVYVVWQHRETPSGPEEVYKGSRHLYQATFTWTNISLTTDTRSLYPVNASGLFTVYTDYISPYPDHGAEIFYKINPNDIALNISQTAEASSFYPHSIAKFTAASSYIYTVWLDGDAIPYRIHSKKLLHLIPTNIPYLASINGHETPSPYLVARDSFMSKWQIPVDIGNESIAYQFQLEPGYRYKCKLVAYHQSAGEWREWIRIDNKMKHQIKYQAFEPETLAFWIPPADYNKDSLIEVIFDRISGDFAAVGSIEIYRYEYEAGEQEAGSGPMTWDGYQLDASYRTVFPNPFSDNLNISCMKTTVIHHTSVKIYDITGRLLKDLGDIMPDGNGRLVWNGTDEKGRTIAPGIYFLTIKDFDNHETSCHKVIKMK